MVAMRDKGRKWMWGLLAAGILFQFYFVWEYLTVFALFAVGFLALAFTVAAVYSRFAKKPTTPPQANTRPTYRAIVARDNFIIYW